MRIVGDLHLHSPFSRATSGKLSPAWLEAAARIKGLDLIGTGDATHPRWLERLSRELLPAEPGFFRLSDEARREFRAGEGCELGELGDLASRGSLGGLRFVLSAEVSTIYKANGRTRKVHHLILLSGLEGARRFQTRLGRLGNIESDGRPILGLDSRDLFEVLLEADPAAVLVPAHIWTPWFSALGDKSGFESIDECYRDLAPRVGAVETGLSSDPPMNWAVSSLDRFAIISNSDAHSPDKLAREATLYDIEPSFAGLASALSGAAGGQAGRVAGTIEFFPEEGKYHWDGHRACGVILPPAESAALGERCPVCGKPLTVGVLHRVMELADRALDGGPVGLEEGSNRRPFRSFVPLRELLSEILGSGPSSRKVDAAYRALILGAGGELAFLGETSPEEAAVLGRGFLPAEFLAEALRRLRAGAILAEPGSDGEYGRIRLFRDDELSGAAQSGGLFPSLALPPPVPSSSERPERQSPPRVRAAETAEGDAAALCARVSGAPQKSPEQAAAVDHAGRAALVLAGPGAGKTMLLVEHAAKLLEEGLSPETILALSFSAASAAELRERLQRRLGEGGKGIQACTFHAFGRAFLAEAKGQAARKPPRLIGPEEAALLFERCAAEVGGLRASALSAYADERRRFLLLPGESGRSGLAPAPGLPPLLDDLPLEPRLDAGYAAYRAALESAGLLDYGECLLRPARDLAEAAVSRGAAATELRALLVDEYQDLDYAQYALVRLVAPGGSAGPWPFAIGDPDQAIYGFRGADPRFIGKFLEDYPDASVYRLTRSFRCPPAVLEAARSVVGPRETPQSVKPADGIPPAPAASFALAPTEASEAEWIAREAEALVGGTSHFALDSGSAQADGGFSPGDLAVLVRTGAQFEAIARALRDHGIPYRVGGELPWWEEEPARSCVQLLRLALDSDSPLLAELLERKDLGAAATAIRGLGPEVKSRIASIAAPAALREIFSTVGLESETVGELEERAQGFSRLGEFLAVLEGRDGGDGPEPPRNALRLYTIHAAKGLEFEAVFVAGLEEGLLPFTLFDRAPERLAEEARLLYVAMTRARRLLFLSAAKRRRIFGRDLELPPSSFLARFPGELVALRAAGPPPRQRDPQLDLFT